METKKVFITGVTGAIGGALASYFRERGYEVWGAVRRSADGASLPVAPARTVTIDMAGDGGFRLPERLDAVIHCAAATSERAFDSALCRQINVEGTARLAEASVRAGAKRFIYLSTMSANAGNPSDYAQTKLAAETVVLEKAGSAMEAVILRPGLVISTAPRGIFHKMRRFVEKLPVVPVIGTNANLATVSITDLCRSVESAVDAPGASGLRIDVCAAESVSLRTIVNHLAAASGRRVCCVTVPYFAALWLAKLAKALRLPLLTEDNVYGLKYARRADTAPLKQVLGMEADKLERTIALTLGGEGRRLR